MKDHIKAFIKKVFPMVDTSDERNFWITTILIFPKLSGKNAKRKRPSKNNLFTTSNFTKYLGKDGLSLFMKIF